MLASILHLYSIYTVTIPNNTILVYIWYSYNGVRITLLAFQKDLNNF